MLPALIVFAYLAGILYVGVFRYRGRDTGAEGYFLFLASLFGTNMTAFAILGSSGHAFNNGIVTYGLMASSSALVIPLSLFLIRWPQVGAARVFVSDCMRMSSSGSFATPFRPASATSGAAIVSRRP